MCCGSDFELLNDSSKEEEMYAYSGSQVVASEEEQL